MHNQQISEGHNVQLVIEQGLQNLVHRVLAASMKLYYLAAQEVTHVLEGEIQYVRSLQAVQYVGVTEQAPQELSQV